MAWYKPWTWGDESASATQKRNDLNQQSEAAGQFANFGQNAFGAMTTEATAARDALRRRAMGQDSLSGEQLRQGLQQNMAAQRSMAASASPAHAPMAALHAAQNMGRLGAGMSGQAALAGIQERSTAEQALANMILQQRQQDLNAAIGSRQNALSGYTGVTPDKSAIEKWQPMLQAGMGAAAMAASDRRLKEDVADGDEKASRIAKGLRAYSFKYKDEKYGKGEQFGVMAQDLEKADLKHAVVDTPSGKMVHGAKLATANTAMIGALARRLEKLEGKRK